MSKKRGKRDCPRFVTQAECAAATSAIKSELGVVKDDVRLIKTALMGEDMRGGIVKDVGDLKKSRGMTIEIVRWVLTLLFVIFAFVLGKVWP